MASLSTFGLDHLTLYLPRGCAGRSGDSVAEEAPARARLDRKPSSPESRRPASPRRRVGRWPLFAVAILLILCLRDRTNGPPTARDAPPRLALEKLGTTVDFVRSPTEANRLALRAGKLTFTLHVAGDFEDSAFT